MTRTICINLSAAEAKAWAAGATCLIRPLKDVPAGGLRWAQLVSPGWTGWEDMHGRPYRGLWYVGDVLIGREAFSTCTYWPFPTWPDGPHYWANGKPQWGEWTRPQSPATMPAALARHRRRVVSVRVCKGFQITKSEARAAGWEWIDMTNGAYVSVTMLEPAPGKEGS